MDIIKKLKSFKELKNGWYYGEGIKFSGRRINNVEKIINLLLENKFTELDIFPGIDGEIRITIYADQHYYELTFESNNTITFIYEINGINGIKKIYKEYLSFKKCKEMIINYSKLRSLWING